MNTQIESEQELLNFVELSVTMLCNEDEWQEILDSLSFGSDEPGL